MGQSILSTRASSTVERRRTFYLRLNLAIRSLTSADPERAAGFDAPEDRFCVADFATLEGNPLPFFFCFVCFFLPPLPPPPAPAAANSTPSTGDLSVFRPLCTGEDAAVVVHDDADDARFLMRTVSPRVGEVVLVPEVPEVP